MKKRLIALVMLLTAFCYSLKAQSYMLRAERFCADTVCQYIYNLNTSIYWLGGGSRWFYYSTEDESGKKWCLADTKKCKRKYFSTKKELEKEMERLSLSEKNEYFRSRGKYYNRKYSADSLYYINSVGDDLVLYDNTSETTDSLFLSSDGENFHSFTVGGNRHRTSDIKGKIGYSIGGWIGKSHSYLAVREDNRKVGTLTLVDNLAEPRPKAKTYKFAMPGDKEVSHFEAFLADADSAYLYPLPVERFADQVILMPRFRNFQTSDTSAFLLRLARTRDTLDLVRIDAKSHRVTTIISEVCKPHLNEMLFDYHVINNGKEILWWSERSGKGRWYLYSGDGKLRNALTAEDFVSGAIIKIDTLGRNIIFEGYGKEEGVNPNYKFYYKASFDGKKPCTLLTPGDGEHSARLSPDGKLLYDSWSRMDLVPRHQICDLKGRVVMNLESADPSRLLEKGWKAPKVLEVTAADSLTKLYGVVYLPSEIEPGKKYPIISNVYPGPQTDLVPQAFTPDDNGNATLADLGFVVVNFSYRGSNPLRGRDFYNWGYGNLRDYALEDDYAVIKQVAEIFPFADTTRVGIYGHSGGGFMAAAAMLTRPDFYKVCISASGNHDNNIYTQWWGESFHGVKQTKDSLGNVHFDCKIPTNMELAGNLRGKLLLITGDVDDNVHPASTLRFARALIQHNKRFDMLVVPGVDHGLGDSYYQNIIRYYFVENLLGLKIDDNDIVSHQ